MLVTDNSQTQLTFKKLLVHVPHILSNECHRESHTVGTGNNIVASGWVGQRDSLITQVWNEIWRNGFHYSIELESAKF